MSKYVNAFGQIVEYEIEPTEAEKTVVDTTIQVLTPPSVSTPKTPELTAVEAQPIGTFPK